MRIYTRSQARRTTDTSQSKEKRPPHEQQLHDEREKRASEEAGRSNVLNYHDGRKELESAAGIDSRPNSVEQGSRPSDAILYYNIGESVPIPIVTNSHSLPVVTTQRSVGKRRVKAKDYVAMADADNEFELFSDNDEDWILPNSERD